MRSHPRKPRRTWSRRLPARPAQRHSRQVLANHKRFHTDGDPLAEKSRAERMPAVADERVYNRMAVGWRNPKYGHDRMSILARFAFPRSGKSRGGLIRLTGCAFPVCQI